MTLTEIPWESQAGYPVLATLQLLPLLAAALVLALRSERVAFRVGLLAAVAELLPAYDLFQRFDSTRPEFQFAERLRLTDVFGYHAAADGVTVLFVLLTALLTLMVVLYGRVRPLDPHRRFVATVLATEASLMSAFVTVDLLWFTLLSAAQLVLVAYLLWAWATSPEREVALGRYLQFMGTGVALLLGGALMLAWNYADASGGQWSFDLTALVGVPVDPAVSSVVFYLLFYGLAIRVPLFPLHGWLPIAAEHGTIAVAPVFLLGLKTGVYGMLRFVLPVVPEAVLYWHPYVAAFAVAGIFYSATLAFMQQNLRRLLAYAVVSHTSVLVIGLFSLSHTAFQGSVMLSINFGLASAGLLFMAGMVFSRTHTLLLPRLGGLFDRIPQIGIAFFVAGLSIVGMPGTPGFDAAHLILEAAIDRFGALVTIAAALGNVVAAGFLLWSFQRAFLAPRTAHQSQEAIPPATPLELLLAAMIVVVLLGVGFFGEPWLKLIDTSLQGVSALYGEHH